MPTLKLITLGESLNCSISLRKLEATSHWANFSRALLPAMKLISLGRSLNCGISLSKLKAASFLESALRDTAGHRIAHTFANCEQSLAASSRPHELPQQQSQAASSQPHEHDNCGISLSKLKCGCGCCGGCWLRPRLLQKRR
jgi:hypothetical protein